MPTQPKSNDYFIIIKNYSCFFILQYFATPLLLASTKLLIGRSENGHPIRVTAHPHYLASFEDQLQRYVGGEGCFFLEHPALGYFKNWWYLACHATTTTKYAVVCGFSRKMHRSPLPTPPWFDGWTNHRFNFSETKCKRAKACQFKIPFLGRNYRHPLQITLSVCLAAVCLM